MLNMDYSKLDDPKIRELKERIRRDNNWGAGLFSVIWQGNGIIHGALKLILAFVVGAPVIYHMIISKNPVIYILLFAIIVLVVISKKGNVYYQKKLYDFMYKEYDSDEERIEVANVAWDYAFGESYNYKNGKDIRIYGAWEILNHWTKEQAASKKAISNINNASRNAVKSYVIGNVEPML